LQTNLLQIIDWFSNSPGARLAAGLLFFGLFGLVFFRTTRGVGKYIFIICSILLAVVFVLSAYAHLWGFAILAIVALLAPRLRKTKRNYEHAVARVEGGGIKRGLTPPEAAVLLGAPFNVILTLVVFGLLRKGILQHISDYPFVVSLADGFRTREKSLNAEQRADLRREAAQSTNITLYPYEGIFIELFDQNDQLRVHDIDFSILVKPFIQLIAERIAGYDLDESREYYRLIIKRAPKEARTEGVLVAEKDKVFDRNILWILLHKDFSEILDAGSKPYFPVWLRSERDNRVLIGKERTFASWAAGIMEEMKATVPESALKIKLGREIDDVTAHLMAEISRATFYG
jgi:hypothetical protein